MQAKALKFCTVIAAFGVAGLAMASDTTMTPVEVWEADPTVVFDAAEVDLEDFKLPTPTRANGPQFGRLCDRAALF